MNKSKYQKFPQRRRLKICLAASSGGHLTQLLRLIKACDGHQSFLVTNELAGLSGDIGKRKVYVITKANRLHPLRLVRMFAQCLNVFITEKPDVVMSTGAAVGCVMCLFGKVMGRHIVWVDSIANIDRLSLSGRIIRPIADVFLVQWPHLAQQYSRVKYLGSTV